MDLASANYALLHSCPTYLRFILPLHIARNFSFFRVGKEGQIEQRETTVADGRATRRRCRVTSAARSGTEAATLRGDLTR